MSGFGAARQVLWHVVSIDEAGVLRPLFQSLSRWRCVEEEDRRWFRATGAECIGVLPDYDPGLRAALRGGNN